MDLRIKAFVTEGLGLGCPDQKLRAKAARYIRKAAKIMDRAESLVTEPQP